MTKDTTETEEPVARGSVALLFLGLVWLGTTAYAVHTAVNGSASSGRLALAIAALPGVVAATLVASASIGAVASRHRRSAGGRLRLGLVLGSLFGLAAAAGSWFGYGGGAPVSELAVTVGAAGIVGGALATLPHDVLKVGLWGTTWVFVAGVMVGVARPNLVTLLGSGEAADTRLVLGLSVVSGLIAALPPLLNLRATRNRALWSFIAGGLPGVVLLGAEGLTRAGSALAQRVPGLRNESPALIEPSGPAGPRHALIVLAVGGLVAMLASALKSLPSRPRGGHEPVAVDDFHHGLARIGLSAGEQYGFALAGGYAVQFAGFLKRPSEDIDLFTAWERRDDFDIGARAIAAAFLAAGLTVEGERGHDTFIRLTVSDGVQSAKVELGLDTRAHEPVRVAIGPVIHPDDAVTNKVRALYERAHACDFIDIDAVLRSGRYDRPTLLRLAEQSDITFDRRQFANALAQAQSLDADSFTRYGLVGADLNELRQRYALWHTELLGAHL